MRLRASATGGAGAWPAAPRTAPRWPPPRGGRRQGPSRALRRSRPRPLPLRARPEQLLTAKGTPEDLPGHVVRQLVDDPDVPGPLEPCDVSLQEVQDVLG